MDCKEVQGFLHAYLDGEFDEAERVAMASHLQVCDECGGQLRFESAFRRKVRDSLAVEQPAPPHLVARVRGALSRVEVGKPAESWTIRGLRWLIPAAAATLLVGVVVSRRRDEPPREALAEYSIQWHRRNLPLDVQATTPGAVRGFFTDKVPFAVRPPVFRRKHARLVGGRLANLREHEAAYLTYQVDGRRVSVFIFDPQALDVQQVQQGIHWRRLRGYNVALFSSRGTGYAVTTDMEPEQLGRLVSW